MKENPERSDRNKQISRVSEKTPRYPRCSLSIWFWIVFTISRIIILFMPFGFAHNLGEFLQFGDSVLSYSSPYGKLAQESSGFLVIKYPPLYLVQAAVLITIFGTTPFGLRIGFLIIDLGIILVLYKFSLEMGKPNLERAKRNAVSTILIYSFSLPVLLITLGLPQKFMAQFFMLLGLFAFYKEKYWLVGISLCIGFLTELYPVFCMIPIGLFLITRHEWKSFLVLIVTFLSTFLAISLPFILLDIQSFIFSFFTHFSRTPQVLTLWDYIPAQQEWKLEILGILQLSPLAITFLAALVVFSLIIFIFFKKRENVRKEEVLKIIIIFYLCIPILFLTLNSRNLYWIFPLISVVVRNDINERTSLILASIFTSILFLLLVIEQIFFPSLIFQDFTKIPEGTLSNWSVENLTCYGFAFLLISIAWLIHRKGFSSGRTQRYNAFSIVNYLNVVVLIFFVQVFSQLWFSEFQNFIFFATIVLFIGLGIMEYVAYFMISQLLHTNGTADFVRIPRATEFQG